MSLRALLWNINNRSNDDWLASAMMFWLENDHGDSVYIVKIGNGWAVKIQEAYLIKDKMQFVFKGDIPGFEHSVLPVPGMEWNHIYPTKEIALEHYLKYKNK